MCLDDLAVAHGEHLGVAEDLVGRRARATCPLAPSRRPGAASSRGRSHSSCPSGFAVETTRLLGWPEAVLTPATAAPWAPGTAAWRSRPVPFGPSLAEVVALGPCGCRFRSCHPTPRAGQACRSRRESRLRHPRGLVASAAGDHVIRDGRSGQYGPSSGVHGNQFGDDRHYLVPVAACGPLRGTPQVGDASSTSALTQCHQATRQDHTIRVDRLGLAARPCGGWVDMTRSPSALRRLEPPIVITSARDARRSEPC